jgi:hypothetical protein
VEYILKDKKNSRKCNSVGLPLAVMFYYKFYALLDKTMHVLIGIQIFKREM